MGFDLFDVPITGPATAWLPLVLLAGVLGFFLTLHLARFIGIAHGGLAKHLLVKSGARDGAAGA